MRLETLQRCPQRFRLCVGVNLSECLFGQGVKLIQRVGEQDGKGPSCLRKGSFDENTSFLPNCLPTHLRTRCPTELGAAAGWEGVGLEGTWTQEMPISPQGQGCLQAAGVGGLFLQVMACQVLFSLIALLIGLYLPGLLREGK